MNKVMNEVEFRPMPKMGRYARKVVVTEKIDGTNASIYIDMDNDIVMAASRTRWITPESDNFDFAKWVAENREELKQLGHGHHFGEWWGKGIQRGYGLNERRFSLFNADRWTNGIETPPPCCSVVPILWQCNFHELNVDRIMAGLAIEGSIAAPGFMNPEGIVVWHTAAKVGFKKTFDFDETGKDIAQF